MVALSICHHDPQNFTVPGRPRRILDFTKRCPKTGTSWKRFKVPTVNTPQIPKSRGSSAWCENLLVNCAGCPHLLQVTKVELLQGRKIHSVVPGFYLLYLGCPWEMQRCTKRVEPRRVFDELNTCPVRYSKEIHEAFPGQIHKWGNPQRSSKLSFSVMDGRILLHTISGDTLVPLFSSAVFVPVDPKGIAFALFRWCWKPFVLMRIYFSESTCQYLFCSHAHALPGKRLFNAYCYFWIADDWSNMCIVFPVDVELTVVSTLFSVCIDKNDLPEITYLPSVQLHGAGDGKAITIRHNWIARHYGHPKNSIDRRPLWSPASVVFASSASPWCGTLLGAFPLC